MVIKRKKKREWTSVGPEAPVGVAYFIVVADEMVFDMKKKTVVFLDQELAKQFANALLDKFDEMLRDAETRNTKVSEAAVALVELLKSTLLIVTMGGAKWALFQNEQPHTVYTDLASAKAEVMNSKPASTMSPTTASSEDN